ncbi:MULTISPECIES: mycothiol synthase [unclassified Pseudonocardia]|uniref:mycothiol synthase n=1 Tax=unclassified Pseudonocardia TaxID=2619320 RepID=UPI000962E2DE|nr:MULTISPECIES: mycothiol synthase [unclassified Pseudonocardia]MBN9102938.1 mycothiol synthase [Pseudonocardia sp.]OJY51574.1 MAG: mycothiol synthase [Pseudonocardia sp. 73-21]
MVELTWHGELDENEIAEVQALMAGAADVDGTAPLSEHVLMHLRHGGDAEALHLVARDGDALVAFAHLDATDPVAGGAGELVVHPDRRRHGLGEQVVQALLDRMASAGSPAGGRLRLWAHGGHPGAAALAERHGFTRTRTLWQMRRSLLAPLAAPEFPEGVRLRPFVVGRDEPEFLRVNNAAFDWHPEQGGWDVDRMKLREAEPWFDPAGFLLAVDGDDRLLGFHWTKVHGASAGEHSHEPIGEVYVLGVDPAVRGMHLGKALTLAGLRHLRDRGLNQVMLYVEADNEAAIRVYEDLQFTHWDTDVSYVR